MKYKIYPFPVKQEQREEFNRKILYLIDNGETEKYQISGDDIYNAYTGDGGLHGLNSKDYDNYHEYSKAKKGIENGQFFTPPLLCRLIVEALSPKPDDLVADLTCGAGGFFNFLPTESNVYGCEIDTKAYKVARFLYPSANLINTDIRNYDPGVRFDYIVGNPPFNLRWWLRDGEEVCSQMYYCMKAAKLLKPLGIMAIIVPQSFLSDTLTDVRGIREMEDDFHFLGQIELPDTVFGTMGVSSFNTKIQFWQKRSETDGITDKQYHIKTDMSLPKDFTVEKYAPVIRERFIAGAKGLLGQNKYNILHEVAKEKEFSEDFQYRVEKMLYQIKCHPKLKEHYSKCYEYLYRFLTQKMPEDMTYTEWAKTKITEAKVIAYLRNVLKKQNAKPQEDRIALVKQKYSFVYKGYSVKARKVLTEKQKNPVPIYQIASGGDFGEYPGFERLIRAPQNFSHPICVQAGYHALYR